MPSTRPLLKFYLDYSKEISEKIQDEFSDSFVPPCSYWTAWEKEIFFDALKRHSRLRPELIQDEIGDTKTVWEICSYINLLDSACLSAESPSTSYATTSSAVEMTENWIGFEERQAAALIGYEEHLLGKLYSSKDREGTTTVNSHEDSISKWESRRILRNLDTGKLAVLDFFLGDAEPGDATPISRPATPAPDSVTEASLVPTERESTPFDTSGMTVAERKRWRNRLYMRRKRAEKSGAEVDEVTERLKPGRRQKLTPEVASKRGAVTFEKNKAWLEESGITYKQLQMLSMDVFHLSAFGKLSE